MSRKNLAPGKMVSRPLDPADLPPLTAAQRAELRALAAQPDSAIDFSDIPPLSEEFWRSAQRNPLYRPVKQQLTLRLDADIVAWLRATGPGYQTRLNNLLRQAMQQHATAAPRRR